MNLLKDLVLIGAIALTNFASADQFEIGVDFNNNRGGDCRIQGNCGRDGRHDGDWRDGDGRRDHGRGRGDGDWGRDDDFGRGDGGWGPGNGRRHFPKVCYAQNARGRYFEARGRQPAPILGQRAVELCRWNSRRPGTCRFVGCRPL